MFLTSSNFDPKKIDIKYIEELIELIPKSGIVDFNQAEIFAARFLRGADYCIDLVSQAIHYKSIKESEKNEAKALAIAKLIDRGISATSAIQQYNSDKDYLVKAKELAEAEAWLEWIKLKYKNLIAAHVYCKDILRRNLKHEQSSSFKGDTQDIKDWEESGDSSDNKQHNPSNSSDKKFGASDW